MTDPRLRRMWFVAGTLAVLGALVCYGAAGFVGVGGYVLGLFGTSFSLMALWGVVRLLGRTTTPDTPPLRGTAVIVLAFLVKVPLFAAAGVLAYRLGGAAPTCFLAGLGLVYSALVAWALAQS